MDYINELYELCETISREIAKANEKIRAAGGELSGGDYDTIDKITHALKSLKATIKMMEDEDGGYSGDDGSYRREGGYNRRAYGGNSRGWSYARGRGGNTSREGMSRNRGYSRDADIASRLQDMMQYAPNDQVRREMQRLAEKIEEM